MKIKDKLNELEAQLDHLTNRIDNLRDKFVDHIEKVNKSKEPKLEGDVREIVKHWAILQGYSWVRAGLVERETKIIFWIESPDTRTHVEFSGAYVPDVFEAGVYTIDELCGEEE